MTSTTNPFLDDAWMPKYDAMTPEACAAALEASLPKAEAAFRILKPFLDFVNRAIDDFEE